MKAKFYWKDGYKDIEEVTPYTNTTNKSIAPTRWSRFIRKNGTFELNCTTDLVHLLERHDFVKMINEDGSFHYKEE